MGTTTGVGIRGRCAVVWPTMPEPDIDAAAAVDHLTAADPVMGRIIDLVGPFAMQIGRASCRERV